MPAKKILIAEDDKDLSDLLALRCRRMGADVEVVHDAVSALTMLQYFEPDLICLDVNMPGGNGLSVCEMLSTDAQRRRTPVIILTGRQDEQTIRRCHDMCAYYVLKSAEVWQHMEPLVEELLDLKACAN